jgi:hypothetical protein
VSGVGARLRGAGWVAIVTCACSASAGAGAPRPTAEGRLAPVAGARAPEGGAGAGAREAGRTPRRLGVDQLRASLIAATGYGWMENHRVPDPDQVYGSDDREADMLDVLAPTLGRPNFRTSTSETVEPSITFTKAAGDAARSACKRAVAMETGKGTAPILLAHVKPADTLQSSPDAVRANLRYLVLRFWGRVVAPGDPELAPLEQLFDRATHAGAPGDGWRAVCIALATDPQFLTY